MTIWRFSLEDRVAVLLLALLPLLVAAPQLIGWLRGDPLLYTSGMTVGFVEGVLRGFPYVDPNSGFTTQALGRRAAIQWLQGTVPWWNYFTGVGLPLAAEYQPGAFFPLTLLLVFPDGIVLQQAALRFLSGLGTYGLLRQLGVNRFAATTGAILYAFNGTLAWFSHAPATAVPFLPWMLWGVERAFASAVTASAGGWRLLAGAMAMGLLCAFPETSFLSGLLALAWATTRAVQCPSVHRMPYATRIALGGVVGIALAAPQVYGFFHFLSLAHIGLHGDMGGSLLPRIALVPSLLEPYAFGQIFHYAQGKPVFEAIWGGIGGFVTGALVVAAIHGFWARRDALAWLLVAWIVLCLGRTVGIEPMHTLMNLIPGVRYTAFPRYAPPAWELAFVILAARGLGQIVDLKPSRSAWTAAALAAGLVLTVAVAAVLALWPEFNSRGMRNAALGSLGWLALMLAVTAALLGQGSRRAAVGLGALLAVEAMVMTFIPTLSNPRAGKADFPAIHFLRNNLGLNRFYTLGPLEPNYGAYFGIASINHNYLPVSKRWVDWIRANLDQHADPVVFNGNYPRPAGMATQTDELRRNLSNYQWVGVKYVVAGPNDLPLAGVPGARRVYGDGVMSIHELPDPRAYFESENGLCRLAAFERAYAVADCAVADRLIRRELYFPGWTATVNDNERPIAVHRDLFQSIELPAGRSEVRFDYAPPHVTWAWFGALAGLLAMIGGTILRRVRRSAPRSRSAS